MARAGRKPSANAKRRQTTRAGQGRASEDKGTVELRQRKVWATGRTDLPMEPLAVHRCGAAVTAATLGIATRPYAGAWVAAALVERDRPWTARHDTRLALIREGLAAIARLGSREL